MKIEIDGLGIKELESARNALDGLFNAKEEYAKAKRNLDTIEMRMAQYFDTVNYLLRNAKVRDN